MMKKEDMMLLIEVVDALNKMNSVLEQLTGQGYENGDFAKLDNIYQVILHNVHPLYFQSEEKKELSIDILLNQEITTENRAEILLKGMESIPIN